MYIFYTKDIYQIGEKVIWDNKDKIEELFASARIYFKIIKTLEIILKFVDKMHFLEIQKLIVKQIIAS